jgi:hypothetical protein
MSTTEVSEATSNDEECDDSIVILKVAYMTSTPDVTPFVCNKIQFISVILMIRLITFFLTIRANYVLLFPSLSDWIPYVT